MVTRAIAYTTIRCDSSLARRAHNTSPTTLIVSGYNRNSLQKYEEFLNYANKNAFFLLLCAPLVSFCGLFLFLLK